MGSMKKFAQWLSGQRSRKGDDPIRKTITQIKIFNRRLQRQVVKMEQQSKMAKKKAIERRTAGDIKGSKLHMKSSLQFRKWVHATENFRVRLDGVQLEHVFERHPHEGLIVMRRLAGIIASRIKTGYQQEFRHSSEPMKAMYV